MGYIGKFIRLNLLCTLVILVGVLNTRAATYEYDGSLKEVENPSFSKEDLVILIEDDKVVVPESKYKEWRHADSYLMQVTLDTIGIEEFIDVLNSKYSVEGQSKFITHDFYEIDLQNSNIEKEIDKEVAVNDIKTALSMGREKYVRLYVSKINKETNGTYIEISLDEQRVFYYENGSMMFFSDCVTGDVATGKATPTGVYSINLKENGRYLDGENPDGTKYHRWVDYWLPFNGDIGLHDASWRKGQFGGEIYKWAGSHGCVNLPLDFARQLYENVEVGCTVYVYDLGDVRASNKASGNGVSDSGDLVITIEDSFTLG